MNIAKIMFGLMTLGLFLNAELASGQNQNPASGSTPPVVTAPSAPPPPDGVPANTGRPPVTTLKNPASQRDHPSRGAKPDHPQPPAPVKTKLDEFKAAREIYLREKKNLTLIRNGTTEEQRQALLEAQRANREEFQRRMQEIKDEFRNGELRDMIDAAKGAAGQARDRKGEN
jgi:hypothetical protein